MRYGSSGNCIVFDMLPEYKGISIDTIYEKIKSNPTEHIQKVKKHGITNITTICGVMGNNFDYSNGTGKSTILEAVVYSFFEQICRHTLNNSKTEKVTTAIITKINNEYPKDITEAYVEMIFEENEKVYILKRGRELSKNRIDHKKILKFDCINEDKLDSHSGHRTTDTEESISRVIGMDYDNMVNSIVFAQQDLGSFMGGTDLTRKQMLIELLRFDSLINGMLEKTRTKKNLKQAEVDKCNAQILLMIENLQKHLPIESLNKQIAEKEELIKECTISSEKSREDLNDLLKSDVIKELESIKSEGSRVKNDLNNKKKDKESRIQEWVNLSSDVDKSINVKRQEIESSNVKKNELDQKKVVIKQKVELFNAEENKKNLAIVDKAKVTKPKYEAKINELLESKEKTYGIISTLESDIRRYSKEIDLLNDQIESAGDQFVCDKCKSLVSKKHIENEINKNKKEKEKIEAEVSKIKEEQKKYIDDLKESQEKMDKINNWINKEGQLNADIKDFQNNKEKIKEIEIAYEECNLLIQKLIKEKKNLEEKKSQYLLKIEEIGKTFDSEINVLNVQLIELTNKYKEIDGSANDIKNKIENIKKTIEEKSRNKAMYNSQIGSVKKEIEVIGDDNKKLTELRNKYENEKLILGRLESLDTCLGLGGIQSRIISKYLPLLNIYIEEFISVLSGGTIGIKIDINDKGKVDIIIKGGSANSYEMLSGGEKTICKLAISVGMALLSFTRCNQKPEFICIDEVFSSLDESHVETAFKLLNKLKDKFARIIIISHKKEINDRIPNKILVEKDEGMYGRSRIKEIV
jgi:DNA repair exonuclease SbcCD ATPase subunit